MDESMTDLLTTHYVVSVAAGEWQVRLGGVLQSGGLDPNAVVPLCSGLGEVESSKPAMALFELAALARQHDDVRSLLEVGRRRRPHRRARRSAVNGLGRLRELVR